MHKVYALLNGMKEKFFHGKVQHELKSTTGDGVGFCYIDFGKSDGNGYGCGMSDDNDFYEPDLSGGGEETIFGIAFGTKVLTFEEK